MAAGCEDHLQEMHSEHLSPATGLAIAEGSWGPAAPTPTACRKLLSMALAQHKWQAAATLALAVQSALPQQAQAGLNAAFDAVRQPQQARAVTQPDIGNSSIVGNNTRHNLDASSSSSSSRGTQQEQGQGDAVQLAGWLQRQVCAMFSPHPQMQAALCSVVYHII